MAHEHPAIAGVLVSLVILFFLQPHKNKYYQQKSSSASNEDGRRLGANTTTTTTPCTTTTTINLWSGATLTWCISSKRRRLDGHVAATTTNDLSFTLVTETTPAWFGVGFNDGTGNNMIGPPSTNAVIMELDKSGAPTMGRLLLDNMPPTSLDLIPLANEAKASVTKVGEKTTMKFDIVDGKLGVYSLPGPKGTKHTIIWAYGVVGGRRLDGHTSGISYHTSSRRKFKTGVEFLDTKTTTIQVGKDGADDEEFVMPYYEMHGGSLATIWSLTTLLGGCIARYGRSYSWWIDAHQFLQTVATVLSLPLTVLSYLVCSFSNRSFEIKSFCTHFSDSFLLLHTSLTHFSFFLFFSLFLFLRRARVVKPPTLTTPASTDCLASSLLPLPPPKVRWEHLPTHPSSISAVFVATLTVSCSQHVPFIGQ